MPDQTRSEIAYDRLGRPIRMRDAQGNLQTRTLDWLGRVVLVEEPDGNRRQLSYDPEGNLVHATSSGGRAAPEHGSGPRHDVRFTYQGMNRLCARSEAGTTVRFIYDTEEQLTGIVNEHGQVYRFVLGPTGEVDEEHGFDGVMRKYTRDAAGRVVRVDRPGGRAGEERLNQQHGAERPGGQEGAIRSDWQEGASGPEERFSKYKYDPAGRVVRVTHADGSTEHYGYRLDGELISAANQSACVLFERDPLGRVLKETCGRHWVESAYNALGLRVCMRSSLGTDQLIERNQLGDVARVAEAQSGFETHFQRDPLGLELERTLPGGLRSRWQRDALSRPLEHSVTGAQGQTLRAVGYKWAPSDRLHMLLDALSGPTEFRHDALGNLAWARYPDGSAELRMPDAVGNLFKREDRGERRYGPAGQLLAQATERGEIHYAYDSEGNLVEKREPNGCIWRYHWNASGMLERVTRPDGSQVTFAYDPLGRRIKKTYRGQTTHWVWDGNNPLHEWVQDKLKPREEPEVPFAWSADPVAKKREAELASLLAQGPPVRGSKQAPITWLFEPESFSPMAKLVGGEAFSIITDHLGTPVLMADAQGEKVWAAGISTYGELRGLEGERFACPFRWPGQYEDAETGLYYNRFRYYDAEAGHYVTQDPIGLAGGFAFYSYVIDPLTWTDAAGLNGTHTLPERVLLEDGNTRIVHNYGDLAREHAEPIHFHVEENGKQIAKIKADGTVIDGKLNKNAVKAVEQKGAKTKLRRAEKKIAGHIRASGGAAGGKPFRPGVRGGGCGRR